MASLSTMENPVARKPKGRPKKPGGQGIPVRIDSDVHSKGDYLAARHGVPLSEYFSSILRPIVEREFRDVAKELLKPDQ